MTEANSIASPMVGGCKLTKTSSDFLPDATYYKFVYVSITCPEIGFSINKVCQFIAQPLEQHWSTVKRILWYLKDIVSWGLLLQLAPSPSSLILQAYCDID
ncbi:putative mitochondrial protein, partial [Mucuna pruriens]